MTGTKATALDAFAQTRGLGLLRFDYFAHGASDGEFRAATVGRWLADSLAMLDQRTEGRQLLVGSSMGAWMALLLARARPHRVGALVLIAPAPDFTETLLWPSLSEAARAEIEQAGVTLVPSTYGPEPYPLTRALFDDGRRHLVLDAGVDFAGPVRVLQGMADPDVPWGHALKTVAAIRGGDVVLTLVRDGDHRLSRPPDIERLEAAIEDALDHMA